MSSNRRLSFLLSGTLVLVAPLALAGPASACDGGKGSCSCGAASAAEPKGEAAAANTDGAKQPSPDKAACPCGMAGPGHEGCGSDMKGSGEATEKKTGGKLTAVIDPATGALVEPEPGSEPDTAGTAAARAGRQGQDAGQVEQPGGGVMAAFPADRASNAVGSVDGEGKAHAACNRTGSDSQ